MTYAAVAIAGSAVIGYMGQQDASSAAGKRSREQMAQQERYNQLRDPFSMGGNREQYVGQLNELMSGGASSMFEDPVFKAQMAAGNQAVQRQHSAQGDIQSTAETRDLAGMSMGLAGHEFENRYRRLSELSGAGSPSIQTPMGMSPEDEYNMSMGQTSSTAGLFQAGVGLAGMYGRGVGTGSKTGRGASSTGDGIGGSTTISAYERGWR